MWIGVWGLSRTAQPLDHREEIRAALVAGYDAFNDRIEDAYLAIISFLGFRLRQGFTLRQFTIAADCLGQGCGLRDRVDDSNMDGIIRATGPGGAPQEWTLFAIGFESLVQQFFEIDPDWSPDAIVGEEPSPADLGIMITLTDDVRGALTDGRLGHLVTINPDGSPQASVVWIGLDGNDIVIGHLMEGRKVDNIARDPRVALTVEASGTNPVGMTNYLIVHGTARLVDGGAPELLQRLAETYLGPGVKFPPMEDPPTGRVIHITPERIGGVGPWAEGNH